MTISGCCAAFGKRWILGTYLRQPASAGRSAKAGRAQPRAEQVIRWNAQTVAARLRVLGDDILYHRLPTRFTMQKQIGALEKIAHQHPDNPSDSSATGTSVASPACFAPSVRFTPAV